MRKLILLITHLLALGLGFAAGIYTLPILVAQPGPTTAEVDAATGLQRHQGEFRRDLADSDLLHWGEGLVSVTADHIGFTGRLAPGPDYRLYLSPRFIETESAFEQARPELALIGEVRSFDNFLLPVPEGVDVEAYDTVIVWCERFGQFISAAKYR